MSILNSQKLQTLGDPGLGGVQAAVGQLGVVGALGVLHVAEVEEPLGLPVELADRVELLLAQGAGLVGGGQGVLEGGELAADLGLPGFCPLLLFLLDLLLGVGFDLVEGCLNDAPHDVLCDERFQREWDDGVDLLGGDLQLFCAGLAILLCVVDSAFGGFVCSASDVEVPADETCRDGKDAENKVDDGFCFHCDFLKNYGCRDCAYTSLKQAEDYNIKISVCSSVFVSYIRVIQFYSFFLACLKYF